MKPKLLLLAVALSIVSPLQAALLTSEQLYFDYPTLTDAYYDAIYLPDLTSHSAVSWQANLDPITDADILPVLKAGTIVPGHIYSQADYARIPNVDYLADLTAGTLTADFFAPGPYHVRIVRQSGAAEIFAVHAQATPLETPGKSGGSQESAVPSGDLFLISKAEGPDDYIDTAYDALKHRYGESRVQEDVSDLADAIKRAADSGKAHIELVGHGEAGKITIGSDTLNSQTLHTFLVNLKKKAPNLTHLSFVSCYTASEAWFLQDVKNVIGSASGYTGFVEAYVEKDPEDRKVVKDSWSTNGKHITIPEPPTRALLLELVSLVILTERSIVWIARKNAGIGSRPVART
jgi:hypothetical protein